MEVGVFPDCALCQSPNHRTEDCEIGHRRDAYWLHVAESVLLKICATTGELRDQSGRRVQAAPAAAQMADELLEEAVKRRKI